MQLTEPAPAKVNLALHVRGKLPDGRHQIETVFAFCTDGDVLAAVPAKELTLQAVGPFAGELGDIGDENLVMRAARALQDEAGVGEGNPDSPMSSTKLLTRMWDVDPSHAAAVAPTIGADVPACLLSMTSRGDGAGDELQLVDAGVSDMPILLVNPRVQLSTGDVFAGWNGEDKGPLADWRAGRNDLEAPAIEQVPLVGTVIAWLALQPGASLVRMSGSGATCFALFESEEARDRAEVAVPREWWRLASFLR